MLKSYHPLATHLLSAENTCVHPPQPREVIHINDAALHAMVDFKYLAPLTLDANQSIDEALQELKAHNFPVLLVVNEAKAVIGIVSTEDILGEKPVKLIQEGRLRRADIPVNMVMTPREELVVFDIEHLRHAKIGNIIQTLHLNKQHTLLVVKFDEHHQGHQIIRGLFSASLIGKQLGEDISSAITEAQSIAELQHELDT